VACAIAQGRHRWRPVRVGRHQCAGCSKGTFRPNRRTGSNPIGFLGRCQLPDGSRELPGNRDCKDRLSAGLRAASHLAERHSPLDGVAVRSCDDAV
jgi:hypothetical protein